MKFSVSVTLALIMSALLSGCIVEPPRHEGPGWDRGYERDRYDRDRYDHDRYDHRDWRGDHY